MSRLVVALDVERASEAEAIVDELYDLDVVFKIGLEALLGYREEILRYCEMRDVRCCIDAKLHDIPRTAAAAAAAAVSPGVRMLTIHALGGSAMMRAAVESVATRASEMEIAPPLVFAVTLLTSLSEEEVADLGLEGSPLESVLRLAALARDAGCSGIVCSPREVRELKAVFGDEFLTLVPGIRPANAQRDDQHRSATPAQAVAAGADFLVVGRPIVQARDRRAAAAAILDEMEEHAP